MPSAKRRRLRICGLRVATMVGALSPALATASGFDVPTVGTSVSGPTTADAAAVHFNPAMLSGLEHTQVLGAAQLIVGNVQYTRTRKASYQYADGLELDAPISPAAIDPTKTGVTGQVTATPIAPSGYLFAAGPVIKDRLWLGGGLYAPYAAVLELPDDGPQRWQVIDTTLLVSHAMFSVAVRAHDRVSLGASVGYVGTLLEMHRIQDFAALKTLGEALASPPISQANDLGPDAPTEVRELETLSRPIWLQRTVGHSVTFNAGIVVHPGRDLDLALQYQHGTRVRARGRFVLDMDDPFFTSDLEAQGLDFPARVEGTSRVSFQLPKRLTFGIGGPVNPRVRLDGVLTWSRWSDLDAFDIKL
ncbi:MAG: OmpP1/FadL family transporter, partial [Nannocystaceae bacterium]